MSAQNLTPEMEYMVKILEKLVNIPSPSGYTKRRPSGAFLLPIPAKEALLWKCRERQRKNRNRGRWA